VVETAEHGSAPSCAWRIHKITRQSVSGTARDSASASISGIGAYTTLKGARSAIFVWPWIAPRQHSALTASLIAEAKNRSDFITKRKANWIWRELARASCTPAEVILPKSSCFALLAGYRSSGG